MFISKGTIYVVEGAWKYPSRYAHMRALLHRVGGAIEERARARTALVCAHHLKNVSPKFLCARTDGQTGGCVGVGVTIGQFYFGALCYIVFAFAGPYLFSLHD